MKAGFQSDLLKISEICNGKIICGDPRASIETITSDSRDLGEKNLFIPLVGENFDGHDFIKDLSEKNMITGFLTMKDDFEKYAEKNKIGAVKCDDTLDALGSFARYHRDKINPELIGITGTNGKTTVKELVYSIISVKDRCLKNEKNYNNEIGVPFTLLNLDKNHKAAVIEMGMNHRGEIKRLSKISRPNLSVITNIGAGHLEFLYTVENVAESKSEIMRGMKAGSTIIINRETECFSILEKNAENADLNITTYGLTGESDIYPHDYSLSENEIKIKYGHELFDIPLYGLHNVYNIMAAIAVAEVYGVDLKLVKKALSAFENVDGRSQIFHRGYIIINDTYNSNPLSSRYAFESVKLVFPERRKIAVLSDMKELGSNTDDYHYNAGREIYETGFNKLLAWGSLSLKYIQGAVDSGMSKEDALYFEDKNDIIEYLKDNISENDLVLVKGSRSMKMEEVVNSLIN